jgi:hypothetical protein
VGRLTALPPNKVRSMMGHAYATRAGQLRNACGRRDWAGPRACRTSGGCRAVLRTATEVARLRDAYTSSDFKHTLVNEKDYITGPKVSGYRGIYLVYRYVSDRSHVYNGLQIEVQLSLTRPPAPC